MGWDNEQEYLTEPISLADVSIAAGVGGPPYDLGDMILHGTSWNPLSKMKPVAFPYIAPDRAQAVSAYGKTLWWWQGQPKTTEVAAGLVIQNYTTTSKAIWFESCGLKFIGFLSAIDALRAFSPIANQWHVGVDSPLRDNFSYVRPQGDIHVEPFRKRDLNYYKRTPSYNIIPDYGTETGTQFVNANNPESAKVTCSIMSAASPNSGAASSLSFNDIFDALGGGGFTVLTGIVDGSQVYITLLSTTVVRNDEFIKEIEINLNDSRVWGKTVLGLYCATVRVGQDTYYIPLAQSTGDTPNTPITYSPRRKIYKSWHIDNSVPYYALTFTQKQNYGTSFAWQAVTAMTYFMTSGLMNRWYLKLEIPRKSSTYGFGNNAFKIEFAGQFRNSRGQIELIYYTLESSDTRFVLKNNEVTDSYDWGTTESVVVTAGSGAQTCYLAIYDVFANRNAVETIYGGTIWRVRLWFKGAQSNFNDEPDVVYGSLGDDHLNINVEALQ